MAQPPTTGAEPSMDEILASIRKILNEDEAKAATAPAAAAPHPDAAPPGNVLLLDEAMIVSPGTEPPHGAAAIPLPGPVTPSALAAPVAGAAAPEDAVNAPALLPMPQAGPVPQVVNPPQPIFAPMPDPPANPAPALVGPAAAGAAGASVEALVRTLARERSTATHRGGPTIEDLVRDEMRPLLREWLDTHLPPLVERLVRAEIERVVNRTGS